MSQVLSDAQKEPTTKSPTLTVRTSGPISCTTPTYSWPITWWSTGSAPRYGHRSLPQMQVAARRMIASVGSTIVGSGRCSTRTSPGLYRTTPRMVVCSVRFDQDDPAGPRHPVNVLTQAGRSPCKWVYRQGTPRPHRPAYARHVDNRSEVREFLTTRRARLTPEQVGLPPTRSRRVPGLRRSEVASIAGLSVEYYARLERGQIAGASSSVLEALARALQLDETERAHLFDLARAADGIPTSGRPRRRTATTAASRLSLRWALEAITDGVAFVRDPQQNLLATNVLGRAFYSPVIGDGGRTPNLARFQFLDPASRDFYPDWDRFAEMCVGVMRTEAGRDPHDRGLQNLVGELSTRSEDFP